MDMLLATLDRQVSLTLVIWAFPLAFLIHDLEEIFTMERFTRTYRERFPRWMRGLAAITTRQFVISVAVFLVIILVASFLAATLRSTGLFTILLAIFFLHFFTHLVQPILFRAYTPGLITAVVIVLPYSLYALHRLFQAHALGQDDFGLTLLLAAALIVPAILGARQLGKLLAR
jgi:hypothetical protein